MNANHHHTHFARARSLRAMLFVLLGLSVLSITNATVVAATVYVPDDYPTIQEAIDAVVDGDEIIVRAGEYNEAINLLGKRIYLHSESGPDDTDLVGTGLGSSIIIAESGETLDTVVEGFAIRFGYATEGAAVSIIGNSALTMRNCEFRVNDSEYGGCVWINEGSAVFEDCEFNRNDAAAIASDLADVRVVRCMFEFNEASSGAAIHGDDTSLQIEDCNFSYNRSPGFGGAVYLRGGAFICTESSFFQNACVFDGQGGALYLSRLDTATIERCDFRENRAHSGGAIRSADSNMTIFDCSFTGNDAFESRGAQSKPTAVICPFFLPAFWATPVRPMPAGSSHPRRWTNRSRSNPASFPTTQRTPTAVRCTSGSTGTSKTDAPFDNVSSSETPHMPTTHGEARCSSIPLPRSRRALLTGTMRQMAAP